MSDIYGMGGGQDLMYQLLMQGMMPQPAGPGYGKDGMPKDPTTAEQARQVNLQQDWMKTLFDPMFAAFGGAMGSEGGLDYMQLAGGGQPAAAPPVMLTPTLDNYRATQDPLEMKIMQMIDANATRGTINEAIRSALGDNEALAGDYMQDADELRKEQTSVAQAQAEYAAQVPEASPLEQMYRDAGLPSPLEEYTAENTSGMDRTGAEAELNVLRERLAAQMAKSGEAKAAREGAPAPRRAPTTPAAKPLTTEELIAANMNDGGQDNVVQAVGEAVGGFASKAGSAIADYWNSSANDDAPVANDGSGFLGGPTGAHAGRGMRGGVHGRGASKETDYGKLLDELTRRSSQLETADAGVRNARALHKRQAGRTPTGDAMMARIMQMRAIGLA